MHRAAVTHRQRSLAAMKLAVAALVAFGLDEVGQDVAIRPAGSSSFGPVIEIQRIAADVDHGVHGRASAQYFAARNVNPASSQCWFRLGCEIPVEFCLEQLR